MVFNIDNIDMQLKLFWFTKLKKKKKPLEFFSIKNFTNTFSNLYFFEVLDSKVTYLYNLWFQYLIV